MRFITRIAVATTATTLLSIGSALAAPTHTHHYQPLTASGPMVFGASGGTDAVNELAQNVGAPLAFHAYGLLDGPVLSGRLINIQPTVPWAQIASAARGSSIYNDVVRWADGIKTQPGPIIFTFSHEPMSTPSDYLGNASDFIAAYRRVHDLFVAHGVRNVEYTWNVTSIAFKVPSSDARYAPKWYPGDAYVDNVASEGYNYYNCGEGTGKWLSLSNKVSVPMAWAQSHGKKYVIAEWASQKDPRRPQWLRDARSFLLAHKAEIRGAFYYQSPNPRVGCHWQLDSSADFKAFGKMAKDRANFGG